MFTCRLASKSRVPSSLLILGLFHISFTRDIQLPAPLHILPYVLRKFWLSSPFRLPKPCFPTWHITTLKKDVVFLYETLVDVCQTTRCHILVAGKMHSWLIRDSFWLICSEWLIQITLLTQGPCSWYTLLFAPWQAISTTLNAPLPLDLPPLHRAIVFGY